MSGETAPALAEDILWRLHKGFFANHLNVLPGPYASQDANRVTLAYFVISSLDLLDATDKWDRPKLIDWIYAQQILPDPNDPRTVMPRSHYYMFVVIIIDIKYLGLNEKY